MYRAGIVPECTVWYARRHARATPGSLLSVLPRPSNSSGCILGWQPEPPSDRSHPGPTRLEPRVFPRALPAKRSPENGSCIVNSGYVITSPRNLAGTNPVPPTRRRFWKFRWTSLSRRAPRTPVLNYSSFDFTTSATKVLRAGSAMKKIYGYAFEGTRSSSHEERRPVSECTTCSSAIRKASRTSIVISPVARTTSN